MLELGAEKMGTYSALGAVKKKKAPTVFDNGTERSLRQIISFQNRPKILSWLKNPHEKFSYT